MVLPPVVKKQGTVYILFALFATDHASYLLECYLNRSVLYFPALRNILATSIVVLIKITKNVFFLFLSSTFRSGTDSRNREFGTYESIFEIQNYTPRY